MASLFSLVCLFSAGATAATLFIDDFQDAATSKSKWIFPDPVTSAYSGGVVNLQNKDTTYMWFVTRNMPSKIPTFSLSATFAFTSSASNGIGLACCKTDTSAIIVQLGTTQNLYVYQYSRSGTTELLNVYNSFISTTSNVVTISKQGSTFNFFCNGNFISAATVTDPLFTAGGDIAIVIPAKASAAVDNVVMTDEFKTSPIRTCFYDDFNDADLTGWFTSTITGTVKPTSDGQVLVSNTDAQYSGLVFVNGNFSKSSMKAVTTFKSGTGVYGCIFVYTEVTNQGNKYSTYSFLIDSTQRYGIGDPDSSKIKLNVPKSFVHGATGAKKDTLEILRFNNKYQFKINGTVAEDSLPVRGKAPDAAGFYVGPKTSIAFDMFAVGGDSTGALWPVIMASGNPSKRFFPLLRLPAGGFVAIDALGRINKRFSGNYATELQKGASGVYFLRPAVGGNMIRVKQSTIIK